MTVKTYVKNLKKLADQHIESLKGAEKLSVEEIRVLTEMSAAMLNELGEEQFIALQLKLKIKD